MPTCIWAAVRLFVQGWPMPPGGLSAAPLRSIAPASIWQAFADVTVPLAPGTTLRLEAGANW
jgi:hypothetical protein